MTREKLIQAYCSPRATWQQKLYLGTLIHNGTLPGNLYEELLPLLETVEHEQR